MAKADFQFKSDSLEVAVDWMKEFGPIRFENFLTHVCKEEKHSSAMAEGHSDIVFSSAIGLSANSNSASSVDIEKK